MTKINSNKILESAKVLYSRSGFEEFTIRKLAKELDISHSVLYHYYKTEEDLLKAMFDFTNTELGKKRAALPQTESAKEMLKQRIKFQIDNSQDIVAVLKYYLNHRTQFEKNDHGFVPDKSTLHIEEVLEKGLETGEFHVKDIKDESKVITHAINGFLLEYYPHIPKDSEKSQLVERIYSFIIRCLEGGEKK